MIRVRGYSLLELVVVLVVAGILAAVAIPRFNQPEIDASWFQTQLTAGLRYAQRQAVAQRRTVYVFVTANSMELCYSSTSPCALANAVSDMASGNPYKLTAPSGVTLTPVSFSFNSLGQPSAGSTILVGSVKVEAETGYVCEIDPVTAACR